MVWSRDAIKSNLPLVQRILNYTVDGSIGTQLEKEILGDLPTSDLAIDMPLNWSGQNVEHHIVKLRENQVSLIRVF